MKCWLTILVLCVSAANAQPLRSLKSVPVPVPPGLETYVRDNAALIALGKALFWDMQAGSDGRTACATCHFHAGADHRIQNQLVDPNGAFPLNSRLDSVIFPFRWLADPSNRNSEVLRDLSMRVGSAGLFRRSFVDIEPGQAEELGTDTMDIAPFMTNGTQARRVTVRNSPSVINSVFYVRNFWDGRAQRIFNGFDPGGASTATPGLLLMRDGVLTRSQIRIDNSSLASQAVGPVLDHLEMSYAGRTWAKLGKKILSLAPLAMQSVAPDDSVLGAMARVSGRGLAAGITYGGMVRAAFHSELWESTQLVDESGEVLTGRTGAAGNTREFSQAEYNFPLFWGLALQAYQATLNSNDSPFDRFMEGDQSALTAQEQEGLRIFQQNGRCTTCHGGAEFSAASFTASGQRGNGRAFQHTGVRPASEDAGSGNGAFKSIGLRNVELTGPYFHNGGQSTLEQVVDFYVRGGDFAANNNGIRPFAATTSQKAALVAFLKALTDARVRHQRAPFDHPELCVPDGHLELRPGVLLPGASARFPASAADRWISVPAVGAYGTQQPLQTFQELLAGTGADGSRTHTMTERCMIELQ
ncbi:MAG: hypothetical protein JNL98_21475 [Bryobacterales bacterium]|nr:hypothetical protein [Bryobacterales bacterium]